VDPGGDQGPVVDAAYRLAREHLRAARPYVWNATNLTRQLRDRCIGLAAGYGARIDLVSLEAPPHVLRARNSARARPVPDPVIERMLRRWQTPDPTEAHHVAWITTA
jgi:predicted kinase